MDAGNFTNNFMIATTANNKRMKQMRARRSGAQLF